MSKEKSELTVADNNLPATIEVEGRVLSIDEIASKLKSMEKSGEELTSSYFTLEPGEVERVMFLGNTTMKSKNPEEGETTAVKLLTAEGKICVNGDRIIVGAFKDLQPMTAAEIECTGWQKSPKGKYRLFNIRKLN